MFGEQTKRIFKEFCKLRRRHFATGLGELAVLHASLAGDVATDFHVEWGINENKLNAETAQKNVKGFRSPSITTKEVMLT